MKFAKWTLAVSFGAIALAPTGRAQPALPSAYQVGFYQPGVVNLRDYASPPAGLFIVDYNIGTTSDGYYDLSGNRVDELDLSQVDPSLGNIPLGTGENAYVNALVIAYVSKKLKFLGDARYVATWNPTFATEGFSLSLYPADSSNDARVEGGGSGFGDMSFIPLGLAWSFNKRFDLSFYYTVYAPTGHYETGASNNTSAGYWGQDFQVPFYAYFFKQATALALIPTFEINSHIRGTNIRPGSRLTLEYGISQYITEWLELMLLNANAFQVGNDKGSDVWWRETPLYGKDRTNTFVVGVGTWPWKERLYLSFKYARDYAPRQRFLNNRFVFTLEFVTGLFESR